MKIAFVAQPFDFLPPIRGGSIAIWINELSACLAEKHDITIYSRTRNDRPDRETIGRIQHVRVSTDWDERILTKFQSYGYKIDRLFKRGTETFYRWYYFQKIYYFFYLRAISNAIRKQNPDIIIVPNFSQFVEHLKRSNSNSKIVLVMQCDWLIELNPNIIANRLNVVDAITGCSSYITNGIQRKFPQHAAKCHTVYNASNQDLFQQNGGSNNDQIDEVRRKLNLEGKTVILFTGRVCPEKGVHVLIDAVKLIVRRTPDTVLVIVGGISKQPPSPLWLRTRDEWWAEIEKLNVDYARVLRERSAGIEEHVRFVGSVSHYELSAYYGVGDIYVHPSLWNEPFGMVLTEAMACGCPVVSTRAGGIPEIVIEGETGFLAEPGDANGLADNILTLVMDKSLREAMGQKGKQAVKRCFTWKNTAEMLDIVLNQLVPDKRL